MSQNKDELICNDCLTNHLSVKQTNSSSELKFCDQCLEKRDNDANKLLNDLESLAHQVEKRLEAIENTERELDQWRDQQLQKNRNFWDEYRRQVENFSSCRIENVQYEYTIKQLKNETILKRLQFAKYLSDHFDQFKDQLNHLIKPSLINIISSSIFNYQLNLFLSNNQFNSSQTLEEKNFFFQQLEQLSYLDQITFPKQFILN